MTCAFFVRDTTLDARNRKMKMTCNLFIQRPPSNLSRQKYIIVCHKYINMCLKNAVPTEKM